jgi:hypothetical protein
MRQAQHLLRKGLTLLLCGRTRQQRSPRGVEGAIVEDASRESTASRESAMQNLYQPTPPPFVPSEEQALSIAIAQSVADQAAWQAARASGSSQQQAHQTVLKRSAGEALSKKLWQDGRSAGVKHDSSTALTVARSVRSDAWFTFSAAWAMAML